MWKFILKFTNFLHSTWFLRTFWYMRRMPGYAFSEKCFWRIRLMLCSTGKNSLYKKRVFEKPFFWGQIHGSKWWFWQKSSKVSQLHLGQLAGTKKPRLRLEYLETSKTETKNIVWSIHCGSHGSIGLSVAFTVAEKLGFEVVDRAFYWSFGPGALGIVQKSCWSCVFSHRIARLFFLCCSVPGPTMLRASLASSVLLSLRCGPPWAHYTATPSVVLPHT